MTLIEARGVHVRFGDRVVLEEVDLSVLERECHGIMGPNGARPTRGELYLDGEDVAGLSPHRIARKGVARSFQIMTLFDEYTARDNVMVALPQFRERGFDMRRAAAGDREFKSEAERVLADVGLSDKADIRAKEMPYGDPTSGLGTDGVQRLLALAQKLKGKLTMIVIEHDMSFLFSLADRISVLHWGQVVARGTPPQLQENPWVKRSNLGKFS